MPLAFSSQKEFSVWRNQSSILEDTSLPQISLKGRAHILAGFSNPISHLVKPLGFRSSKNFPLIVVKKTCGILSVKLMKSLDPTIQRNESIGSNNKY
ncbi:hypothetical protein CW304_28920 [Bacillus sp. UFRGS-B20]|nr:hypothetical protein CW304_28920 [Bacillus sp. UFRGS-B20]